MRSHAGQEPARRRRDAPGQTGSPRAAARPQVDVVGEPDRVSPAAAAAATLPASRRRTRTAPGVGRPGHGAGRRSPASGLASPLGSGDHDVVEQAEELVALEGAAGTARRTSWSARTGVRRPRAGRAAPRRWRRSARRCSARSRRGTPRRARPSAGGRGARPPAASTSRGPRVERPVPGQEVEVLGASGTGSPRSAPTPAATAGCGVPADQHVAEVEHDDPRRTRASRRVRRVTSSARRPATKSRPRSPV